MGWFMRVKAVLGTAYSNHKLRLSVGTFYPATYPSELTGLFERQIADYLDEELCWQFDHQNGSTVAHHVTGNRM